jgi:hypothetical protein
MMERPTCKSCLYWDRTGQGRSGGTCRRCPPTGPLKPYAEPTSGEDPAHWHPSEWNVPVTYDFEWCGEHPDFPDYIAWRRINGGTA